MAQIVKNAGKPRVFIVCADQQMITMYKKKGWVITNDILDADVVQFTGGHDINPNFYGQARHSQTTVSARRDRIDIAAFQIAKQLYRPMAGICRGAQFLNVMFGGSMYQHVNNHGNRHLCLDLKTLDTFWATSTHHQMMLAGKMGAVLAIAAEADRKEKMGKSTKAITTIHKYKSRQWLSTIKNNPTSVSAMEHIGDADTEVVYYPAEEEIGWQTALCFQPHPEYVGEDMLADTYFDYLNNYLLK